MGGLPVRCASLSTRQDLLRVFRVRRTHLRVGWRVDGQSHALSRSPRLLKEIQSCTALLPQS